MARGSGWARIARDGERPTCAKSGRLRRASSGSRDGREDPGGNTRCVDGPLPALARGRLGALVAQHPERDRAAVPPQESARGGLERALCEDDFLDGEPVQVSASAIKPHRTSHAGLHLVEKRVRTWTGQAGYSFAPRWISSGERWS